MASFISKSIIMLATSSLLSGCINFQPFVPKPLNENAKGIATVRTTPYGCKVLGEVEGNDGEAKQSDPMVQVSGLSFDRVREGALNDLRNNAIEVIGNSKKRAVLYIVGEVPECNGLCHPNPEILKQQTILHYKVTAQVFECGNKE